MSGDDITAEDEDSDGYKPGEVEIGDRAVLATRDGAHETLAEQDGSAVEVVDTFRDTVEVMLIVDPEAETAGSRLALPVYSILYNQIRPYPDAIRLDEVGPYEDPEYPFINFECPSCGFSLCEWTDCPECGWYDEDSWVATMAWYVDCAECEQTIQTAEVHLCDDCHEDYHVIRSPAQGRRILKDEYDLEPEV